MKYSLRLYFLLLLFPALVCAAPIIDGTNYWQCTTHDKTNKQWFARNVYQKMALNIAFDSCKKESIVPASCKTTRGQCEQFIQGVSISPLWRCTALDRTAIAWRSDLYSQRYDAAFGAQAYCRQKSSVPLTCYVNLVTCVNLNSAIWGI